MQHDRPFIRRHIHIISIRIHLQIRKDKRRLRDIERLVNLIKSLRNLRQRTGPRIHKEHLSIRRLTSFTKNRTGDVSANPNLIARIIVPVSASHRKRRLKLQLQIQRDKCGQCLRSVDIGDILFCSGVPVCRKD